MRGRQVRKQAAVTLRCMQALVRVQARVRARRVRMSVEGQAVQRLLDERQVKNEVLKQAEVVESLISFLHCQNLVFLCYGGLVGRVNDLVTEKFVSGCIAGRVV